VAFPGPSLVPQSVHINRQHSKQSFHPCRPITAPCDTDEHKMRADSSI